MSLYKYVAADRLDVLRALRIRFTQPTALNDPFEFRPLVGGFLKPETTAEALSDELERQLPEASLKYPGLLARLREMHPDIKTELKPAMLAEAAKFIDGIFPYLKEGLFQTLGTGLGILSLTENPASLPMWAHYAENHAGLVFEFDEEHPWFWAKVAETDEFRHLRRVNYVERQPSYLAELNAEDVFYSKLRDWEYEKEWRIIRPLQESSLRVGSDIYLFDVPAGCIRSVIKGARISDKVGQELQCILKGDPRLLQILTYQAEISEQTNTIEIRAAS